MITVTEPALTKIRSEVIEIIEEGKKPMIRLLMGIGWGGPKLRLALEESALHDDEIFEEDGIQFLVNKNARPYFNNVKIDFTRDILGRGEFVILYM